MSDRVAPWRRIEVVARDLVCYRSKLGLTEMLRQLAAHARGAVYTKDDDILLVKTLSAAMLPTVDPALRIERATPGHLAQIGELNCRNCNCRRTKLATSRMAQGASAFLGFRGNELIGYIWWLDARRTAAEPRLPRYNMRLEEHDVYAFDLFVAPQHRRHGTTGWFLGTVEAELSRLGYRRMRSGVVAANRPARWLFATAGHSQVGRYQGEVFLSRLVRHDGALFLAGPGRLKLRTGPVTKRTG